MMENEESRRARHRKILDYAYRQECEARGLIAQKRITLGGIQAGRSWRKRLRGTVFARYSVDAGKRLFVVTLRAQEEFERLSAYMGDALVELRDCGVLVCRDMRPS